MGRLIWAQLRYRVVRLTALLIGILVATTSFTLLTAASRTAQLRTSGTVSAHFAPAYEILVRPKGSRTQLEAQTRTVQPNFLSGIFGGISTADYRRISRINGVDVAAPIAMVGYTLVKVAIPELLPAAENSGSGRALFRYTTSWISGGGSSRVTQPSTYLYLTSDRLKLSNAGKIYELRRGKSRALVCPSRPQARGNPFGPAAQSSAWCWSRVNGTAGAFVSNEPAHRAFATVNWSIPMLIAAVDPAAEAKLDGLDGAVTSGRYLAQSSSPGADIDQPKIPVLAAASSGVGEDAETTVTRLPTPARSVTLSPSRMSRETSVPGSRIVTVRTTAQQAYSALVQAMRGPGNGEPIRQIYVAGPTHYVRDGSRLLTPIKVRNPTSIWQPPQRTSSLFAAPMDDADHQYRTLRQRSETLDLSIPETRVVGLFDPDKIRAFDPLSQVPLGAYQPTAATAVTPASRAALGGSRLLPNLNLGGYVSQPVDLVTSMSALSTLESAGYDINANAPISAIRVRVAGVTGPDPVSLERIREVAQQIAVGTHLDVDIVAGSSPEPVAISLPAGKYGQPRLALTENWVKKGVAVAILNAVDKKSVVLFVLILIVCVLFVANAASAAIRTRRRELGVLVCLGWTRPQLFASVLGELAAIGLAAGVLGLVAALGLSSALGLHASAQRAALAVPIAAAAAVIAGLIPAWLAARADPVESVRPPVVGVRRGYQPRGVAGLAVLNVLRTPGRALVGAASLAIGIAAVTVLTALTFAFHGIVVGSLLGNAVAYQVRGVDYIAVSATIVLGILSVADVIVLNITDRSAELAIIRTVGWPESVLRRLIITEGAILGLAGSLAGAAIGLSAAAAIAGQLPMRLVLVAAAASGGGVVVTTAAALLPARALQRLPVASLMAQE
jgi:putative ABC transport system permease protein